jgi:threonine/homoserine/homoserine lactone efflux protein
MTALPLFALAVAAILVTPGPTNALLCTSAGLVGVRRSLRLIPAEIAGYLIAIAALQMVGGPLMAAVPSFGLTLRIVLVFYLLLLAWRLWHADAAVARLNVPVVTVGQVFLTTVLNPKSLVFAFAVFPPFDGLVEALPYAGVFVLTVGIVAIGWIGFGAMLRRGGGNEMPRILPRVAAVALCTMGAVIAGSAIAASL